jgi:hypothetical protein
VLEMPIARQCALKWMLDSATADAHFGQPGVAR